MKVEFAKSAPAAGLDHFGARLGSLAARITAGAFVCSLAVGASAQEVPADGVYKDRIDWGVLMDMSGPTSASQGIWVNGFQDYMRKVNEAGGINGRKINVLAEDNRYNAATDKIAFEKLVGQTPVIAISGMGTSASQVGLASTIKAGKVPIVGTYTPTKALSEPVSPMVYNGFCGYKEMAQTGIGYMAEKYKLKAPKIMTVAIESTGGKEYHEFVSEVAAKLGGTATSVTMKVSAADVTPQVLEIIAAKPDIVTIYGVANTAILTMKAMQQYGLNIPTFGISYLGSPQLFAAMGPQAGANYSFVSCFTPGGSDQTPGNKELSAFADKVGRGPIKEDINYVAGWVVAQMAAQSLSSLGNAPSRAKLVESMNKGFVVDTKGLSAPITYSKDNHAGPSVLKMFGYDYATSKFRHYGEYSDYQKYTK
ncbi:MAG: ABC transporter substrate-binding protein [Burkholderiaceae bacterium]|nr:ABC transporter substrate-binding protein [Burkholderiaceae bacterium]